MIETLHIGTIGGPVSRLQEALAARGYSVGKVDGAFGPRTHNAVLALQARAGLPITGEVGPAEWAALKADGESPALPEPVLAEHLPYIESKYFNRSVIRTEVRWIVIHCMEAPESSTRAERCAQYMATLDERDADGAPIQKSPHKCFDCDSGVECVRTDRIAYHAPGANRYGIGYEHAGYARQTEAEWLDPFGRSMLSLSAQAAARDCKRWGIPARYVASEELLAGEPGITTHMQVSRAWPRKNAHQDPGLSFPLAWYLERVNRALAVL